VAYLILCSLFILEMLNNFQLSAIEALSKSLCTFLHSILQSLMQLKYISFYSSTTCFGLIGPSSGTIAIIATAVSL
jgi:hypothetical protein